MPRRQEDWVRQRAERIDIGRARKALSVVTPVQAKLGGWQIQVARLRALAERGRANGEPVEAIAEEARQLLDEIEAHRRLLFEQSESLPPEVARRYGHVEVSVPVLEQQLQAAVAAKDWTLAAELTARLADQSAA